MSHCVCRPNARPKESNSPTAAERPEAVKAWSVGGAMSSSYPQNPCSWRRWEAIMPRSGLFSTGIRRGRAHRWLSDRGRKREKDVTKAAQRRQRGGERLRAAVREEFKVCPKDGFITQMDIHREAVWAGIWACPGSGFGVEWRQECVEVTACLLSALSEPCDVLSEGKVRL